MMRIRSILAPVAVMCVCLAGGHAGEYNLPEVKVKETVIDISPKMQVYIPNGALDLHVGRKYRRTTFAFSSTYDLTDNFLGFGLDFRYDLAPYAAGINLFDRVDFSEFYGDGEYLQRTQSLGPYVQYQWAKETRLAFALNFERTYTDSVRTLERVDQGRNIVAAAGFSRDTLEEEDVPRGEKLTVDVKNSVPSLGSDYNYLLAELNYRGISYLSPRTYLDCAFRTGYPLYIAHKPLSELYSAGGYRVLRGYGFKEFLGDALLYGTASYVIPVVPLRNRPATLPSSSLVNWSVFADAAKIGDETIFTRPEGLKSSIGTEISLNLTFFKYFPVKLGLAAAKAFEDRPVAYYMTIITNYYTWRGL